MSRAAQGLAPTTLTKKKPGPKPGATNLPVRITPELKAAGERVATATGRSLSNLMHYALRRYIEKNYPAALKPGAAALKPPFDDAPGK